VTADPGSRRRPERELRELSGLLIHAHEQERVRIARELHDGVAQGLSILALELQRLAENGPVDIRGEVRQLSMRVAELGTELHRVSHDLHPVLLEQLGLEAAIRTYGRDLSRAARIDLNIEVHDIPDRVPQTVALCLYRVAQEALNNVVRHSGASSAMVRLAAVHGEIALTVTDRGVGFDQFAPPVRAALGLKSMQERVRLVNGHIGVHSTKGKGTRIEVRVPLSDREP
jgi:signal transduction histidine kinase